VNELRITTAEPLTAKKMYVKKNRPRLDLNWRLISQIGFALFNAAIGVQFYRFVHAGLDGSPGPLPYRPPGVEGWLPISGLMGLVDWINRGSLNQVHPAATIVLLAIVVIAIVMRKAFCSWLCPVGFLSEYLAKLGRVLFHRRRSIQLPQWLDYPLMGAKYFLLGFFFWAFLMMGAEGIAAFLDSPYNRVSDVKMLLFFEHMGMTGLSVFGFLILGSIVLEGFWCRYLCPYGALLGLFSFSSPVKIRRDAKTCIDCCKCDRVCPSRLPVMKKMMIKSPECTGCMNCVEACPVADTLRLGTKHKTIPAMKAGAVIISIIILFSLGARMLGIWESGLGDEEYRHHIEKLESPEYGHPGS
jgi:ferredoxin